MKEEKELLYKITAEIEDRVADTRASLQENQFNDYLSRGISIAVFISAILAAAVVKCNKFQRTLQPKPRLALPISTPDVQLVQMEAGTLAKAPCRPIIPTALTYN